MDTGTDHIKKLYLTDSTHPSKVLLNSTPLNKSLYEKYLEDCLAERKYLGPGKSLEMVTLYRFWCYYLEKQFSSSMYNDFKRLALEDEKFGFRYGIECLFRFYSYGLERSFRPQIYEDFKAEVIADYNKGPSSQTEILNKKSQNKKKISYRGHLYGLEKYWAFMKYYKYSSNLNVNSRLHALLSKYKTLEDFRERKGEKSDKK